MSHNSIANYYNLNFLLMHYHKYSLSDIENMIPFERDIYVGLLETELQKQKEQHKVNV